MLKSRKSVVSVFLVCILAVSTLLMGGCSEDDPDQSLRVNLTKNPNTIDPQKALEAEDISIAVKLFDGLLGYNQDLSLKPVVAEEIPTVANGGISEDGLVYTFNIRQDVTWSDGEQVTAQDFVYSMERLFTYDTGAPYSPVYDSVVENAYEYWLGTEDGGIPSVELGVKAIDDYTLEITLIEPCYSFLERMALWAVYPIRQDIVEEYGDDWAMDPDTYIGNGPFILSEWKTDDHITLVKNPNYWGTPAKLDEVRYAMYADDAAEYLAYKAGDLDISRVPAGTETTLANSTELLSYSLLKTNAFFFDCSEPPFDNAKLRKAFAMAVNRTDLVDKLMGGRGEVTYCWVPAGMPGYDVTYQQTCGSQYAFDASGAQQMLEEALVELDGYDSVADFSITLYYGSGASNSTIAQYIQGELDDNLGVNIDLVEIEPGSFYDRVELERDKWDMVYSGFATDYTDPDNWLPDFFATDGVYNYYYFSQYSNTAFDDKVAEALGVADTEQRLNLWQEAEALMVEDAPAIFLFDDEMFMLVKDKVKGITVTAMDLCIPGDMFMADIYID